jgi:(5-formylfuran-3-yl)methyl phosphate synthase
MSQAMQVLVSVTSVAEAQLVLSAGVSLIDLKDTSHGALAALDIETSKAITTIVHAHRERSARPEIIISATVGDNCNTAPDLMALIDQRLQIGIVVIKLPEAIWANPDYQSIIDGFLVQGIKMIAVLMPASLMAATLEKRLQSLAQQGYWGVMVDTMQKSSTLVEMVSMPILANFVRTAQSLQLVVGVAGGLSLAHVASLSELGPDYLGFRSGVCVDGQRSKGLLPERVHQLVSTVSGSLLDNWSQTQ